LRKIDGLNVRETADLPGIGGDAVRQQTSIGMRLLADHIYSAANRPAAKPRLIARHKTGGEA